MQLQVPAQGRLILTHTRPHQVQYRWRVLHPDADQLTRDIMPLGKRVQALPGNELLRDLPLERDAVGTLPGHGFHPLKAQLTLSNH
jgi:hypothetical protein